MWRDEENAEDVVQESRVRVQISDKGSFSVAKQVPNFSPILTKGYLWKNVSTEDFSLSSIRYRWSE